MVAFALLFFCLIFFNMNFYNYSLFLVLSQIIFSFGCYGQSQHALIVTKNNDSFTLTIPKILNPNEMNATFKIPLNGTTYEFCPAPIYYHFQDKPRLAPNVWQTERRFMFAETINDAKKCFIDAKPILLKVTNAHELKENWKAHIELFHSGFLLYIENIKNNFNLTKCCFGSETRPKYEELNDDNYDLLWEIEIHFNNEIQQTVAVEYSLRSVDVFQKQSIEKFEKLAPNRAVPPFEKYNIFELEKGKQFLKEKTGTEPEKYLGKLNSLKKIIVPIPFAPPDHFHITMWKKPIEIWTNQTPMWLHVRKTIERAVTFARFIAKHLGKLKVATGITGIMFLPNEKHKSEDDPRPVDGVKSDDNYELLEDKDTNLRMANYYWSAYEYYDGKEWFGVFVVLHCNPFLDITVDICEDVCENNGWKIFNSDFKRGKMYCCEMTEEVINKLEANFLESKSRKIFNLNNWPKAKTLIYKNFEPFEIFKGY